MTENGRVEIPERYRDLLEGTILMPVATVGPHGEPQNNPVWFARDGENTAFSQKYHNIGREPRVALCLVNPENPYRHPAVCGEVDRVEDDPENASTSATAKRDLGRNEYPARQPGDERAVVYVSPQHTAQQGA